MLSLVLLGVVFSVDIWSEGLVHGTALYLLPVGTAAWFLGRWEGVMMTFLSAGAWLLAASVMAGSLSLSMLPVFFMQVVGLLVFGLVVFVLRAKMNHIEIMATRDHLTELANARAFDEGARLEMRRAQRQGHPFVVAYVDLDNFKHVNDQFGHSVGDELLRVVGAVLSETLRATDIAARLGGDEFAVLLSDTDEEGAHAFFTRAHERLTEEMNAHGWPTTFSIGVVTFRYVPGSVDEVIRVADNLMYAVKGSGKNDIVYTTLDAPASVDALPVVS